MKKVTLTSSLDFGSFLNLSPRGSSEISAKSRTHCNALKQGQIKTIERMVLAIKKRYDDGLYRKILGPDRILVPVPGHAPLVKGGLWVPQLLADQMVSVGLGKKVSTSISRIKAVKKSSTARWGERPDVEDHYNTIVLNQGEIFNGNEVTLIDDVITRGCSLYACCALLKKFNPRIHVASFSVFKTKGYTPEIDKFVDPTEGTISYNGWKADRQP